MSIDWKPVVVSALIAFAIAVVSGGIGGVPFGVLLLRAVLGAIIFGAGAVGVQYLVQKFLPELTGESEAISEGESETGGSVDIVISDEDEEIVTTSQQTEAEDDSDVGFQPVVGEFEEDDAAAPEDSSADGAPEFQPGMPVASVSDNDDDEPLVEEVQEEAVEGTEEAASVSAGSEEDSPADESDVADAAGLDDLPDVGVFSGSFMADNVSEEPAQERTGPRSDGQDPESLAKAIRTLMKRQDS